MLIDFYAPSLNLEMKAIETQLKLMGELLPKAMIAKPENPARNQLITAGFAIAKAIEAFVAEAKAKLARLAGEIAQESDR
jgi:hypothetical protein